MLYFRFGSSDDTLEFIDDLFDVELETEWLAHPLVRQMVEDVDNSIVVKDRYIESPVFGAMAPTELSGGVKMLIMLLFCPDMYSWYYGTAMGNNCMKWVLEIAKLHDVHLAFEHVPVFPEPFELIVANNGECVTSMLHLLVLSESFFDSPEDYGYEW